MKILHWNTHHGGVGTDGKYNLDRLVQWILKFEPDHCSFNEVEMNSSYGQVDWLEYVRSALVTSQKREWSGVFCTMTGSSKPAGIGIALLSSFPLADVARKKLYADRPAVYAKASFGSFYTTHPVSGDSQDCNVQLTQQLCWHKDQPDPRILCGDFNAVPSSIELAPWFVWYSDAWTEAKKLGTAKSFTSDGATKSKRIDYIFYRGMSLVSCEVPDTSVNGIFPSDHHPVIATFK